MNIDPYSEDRENELAERLLRWNELRQSGGPGMARKLILDTPDLAPELYRRIAALDRMERLLGLEVENSSGGNSYLSPFDPKKKTDEEQLDFTQEKLPSIPGYEILKVVGKGGMGIVYFARHLALNRPVALKMIRAIGGTTPEQRTRFLNEAKLVAQLNHPNIVPIYEVGEHEGQPYFSMEYVTGETLAQNLSRSPLMEPLYAALLVKTLALAMDHAHGRGVLHRDLKPANVLLGKCAGMVPGTEAIVPKISDFGLGRLIDLPSSQTLSLAILGTPSYMAPEQASGQARKIGPAADIYALGVILYECLLGVPPFRGSTLLLTLHQVCNAEPEPLIGIPRDLETICLKCLEKQPEKRYHTAAALADDLTRFLEGMPIAARPASSLEKVRKWVWRKPTLAALIAVSFLSVVAFTLMLFSYNVVLKTERDAAVTAKNLAEQERDRADEQRRRAQELVRHSLDIVIRSTKDIDAGRASKEYEGTAAALFFVMACAYADIAEGYAHATRMAAEDRQVLVEGYDKTAFELLKMAESHEYFHRESARQKLAMEPRLQRLRKLPGFEEWAKKLR